MIKEETHWRTYKTDCDAHPRDNENRENSEALIFSNAEWAGPWEPFAAVTTGRTWEGGAGSHQAWTVWRRPCRKVEAKE